VTALAVVSPKAEALGLAFERHVLGALILEPGRIAEVVQRLAAEDFQRPRHGAVYASMRRLHERGAIVEPLNIAADLQAHGESAASWGGPDFLLDCAEEVVTAAALLDHVGHVAEAAHRRRIVDELRRASEAAASGATADELNSMLAAVQTQRATVADVGLRSPFELAALPPRHLLCDAGLGVGELGSIFGGYGGLKTFLGVAKCVAVADGTPWLGYACRQGRAIYVCGEGGAAIVDRLRAAVGVARIADPDDSIHHNLKVTSKVPNLLDAAARERFAAAAEEGGPVALVMFDTVQRLLGAAGLDENSTADVTALIGALDALRARLPGAAVILVHHAGKTGIGEPRGSSVLPASLDWCVRVEPTAKGPTPSVLVTTTKQKDGLAPAPIEVRFAQVVVAEREGRQVTSLTVDGFTTATATPKTKTPTADEAIAVALAHAGDEGLSFTQLKQAASRSNATIADAIKRLAEKGLVVQVTTGTRHRWRRP
jgi:hypothetical protein